MKGRILILLALSMAAVSATASTEMPKEKGPEVIRLKMNDMELPFKHWKHQKSLNNECFHCHNTKLGTIDDWGKETAHKLCISCHELEEKGPVYCRQCHGKKKK